ncbi:hypothetical protein AXG93_4548s1000 [Marchantia polymorpha subsp. ruderalis]|uniref:Uncharacterized protein n=1 Tax=Marchantia polymorpha subsp. ruderalis TaxID=1480154 RepID=A0A176W9R1_MARPO|nr:hypothetical protein AXG93_4548s1000 [Marchantia polymorpha subsp. ruderalis]
MDKNQNEGEDLQGNPMLWTIEHWTRVLESCARNNGDFMFEKDSVKITRAEEFTFAPLFRNARSRTNRWKTLNYKDTMRHAIALGVMHILRPQRTTYVTAWQSRARAKPKKKANSRVIVIESSESCVEKTVGAAAVTTEDKNIEPTLQVLEGGLSALLVEVPTEVAVESLEESTEITSSSFLSSEQTRSVGSEDVPQPKKSEELAKELMLSEAILELLVAQVGGTVVDITNIPPPPPPEEEVRSEVAEKTSEEGPKLLKIAFLDFLQDSVVPLLKYFRGQIATTRTEQEELQSRIAELANDRDKEFKRAEELTASLAEELEKHKGADGSSEDAVTATSDGTAPESSSPHAVEIPRRSE